MKAFSRDPINLLKESETEQDRLDFPRLAAFSYRNGLYFPHGESGIKNQPTPRPNPNPDPSPDPFPNPGPVPNPPPQPPSPPTPIPKIQEEN